MAEKTLLEKAAMAVGIGIAMAEDLAGTTKAAVGAAVTTVTEVLKTAPGPEAPGRPLAKKAPATKSAKAPTTKTRAAKAVQKPATRAPAKKLTATKAVKKASPSKTPAKNAIKKPIKKSIKKAVKKSAQGRKSL